MGRGRGTRRAGLALGVLLLASVSAAALTARAQSTQAFPDVVFGSASGRPGGAAPEPPAPTPPAVAPPAAEVIASANGGAHPDAAAPDPLALPLAPGSGPQPPPERAETGQSSVALALSSSQPAALPSEGRAAGGDPPAVVFDIGGAAEPVQKARATGQEMEFAADPAARQFDLTAKPAETAGAAADPKASSPAAGAMRLVRRPNAGDQQVLARADLEEVFKVVFPQAADGSRPDGVRTIAGGLTTLPLVTPSDDEPDDSRDVIDTLTLGDYVLRTLRRSEALQAERYQVKSAKLQAVSQLANLGPHVQYNWESGHEQSYSSVSSTPVTDPDHQRTDIVALLTQPIFDPVTLAALDRDRESARGAEMKRRMAEVNASYEAVAAYFDLLDSRLELELARGNTRRMNDLYDYMKRRTELGGSSEADLQRVHAVTLAAERNEIDARSGLDTALSNLRRLAGVSAVQIAAPNVIEARVPQSSEEAYQRLVRTNPDMRWAYIQVKIAHDESLAAAAQMLPKISFNLGRYANVNASGAQGTTVDTRALVSAQVAFGSGVEIAESLSQSAHAESLKHRYLDLLRSAQDRLRTLYLTLNSLDGQRSLAWKEYKANEKVTAAFDEQLFAANRSILDVLDTYQKYYQSKTNIVRLTLDQMKIAYQIRQLVGDLNQDSVGDEAEGVT